MSDVSSTAPTAATVERRMKPWLDYASRRMHVFPVHGIVSGRCTCRDSTCKSPGKHPRINDWENAATYDVTTIEQWVRKWPDANIGWALGRDGKGAIDVDPRHDGDTSFAELERELGPIDTKRQATGGGGEDHIVTVPAGVMLQSRAPAFGKAYPGVDFRTIGGFIILAPSRHFSGGTYAWDAGAPTTVQTLPKAWSDALLAQQNGAQAARKTIPGIDDDTRVNEGARHQALLAYSGRCAHSGMDAEQIHAALIVYSETRFNVPHSQAEIDDELRRISDSAFKKYGKRTTTTTSSVDADADDDWGTLVEPVIPKITVPLLPQRLLPPSLEPWIRDEAERMCVHSEMIALPALLALGSIVGCSLAIRPKRDDPGFLVIPSTWGACVAPPGFTKSPALNAAMAPLYELRQKAFESYNNNKAVTDARREIVETERDAVMAKLTTEIKKVKSDNATIESFRQRIAALDSEMATLQAIERRYVTNDATIQKLAMLLTENLRGLLLLRDEVAGWVATFDNPGHAEDRKFFLQSWQGRGPYSVDRVGRGTLHVPHLSLAVYGNIQPGPMADYVSQAQGTSAFNDGLLQRFQLTACLDELPAWENVDRPRDQAARDRAFGVFKSLADLDATQYGARLVDDIPTLPFAPDAQELFDDYRDKLERRLRTDEELRANPALAAHLSKYRSLMPAMALLYHLAEAAASGIFDTPVSLRAAQIGIAWTEHLEPHARKLYAGGTGAAVCSPTEKLIDEIERGVIRDKTRIRDIYEHHWRGLDTSDRVRQAFGPLVDAQWARIEQVRTTGSRGRPTEIVRLHPEWRASPETGRF